MGLLVRQEMLTQRTNSQPSTNEPAKLHHFQAVLKFKMVISKQYIAY